MKINKKATDNNLYFHSIAAGEVFEVKGSFYIKTAYDPQYNSVNLETGARSFWSNGTPVRLVHGYFQET